jgi:beta-lactam-binding protein with PASTA domain
VQENGSMKMPNLAGKSIKDCANILKEMGLERKATGAGIAVAQDPEKDTPVWPGDTVEVYFDLPFGGE